ncbi:MAG TPA: alginate lyase family protein, partial [Brevundimonas sp.]|nr:alginate lyase family protein [Brevundimonas sp.]
QERAGMRAWFGDLVDWMATSPNGLAEKAADNNHSVFYDLLISHFALYAGREDFARATIGRFGEARVRQQIEPDGRMPEELARTRSLHYSTWTLTAAFDVADLGRCVGIDVWNYSSPDGRSLRAATEFIAGWAGREGEWPWPEQDRSATGGIYEVLRRGSWAWSDPVLASKAEIYSGRPGAAEIDLEVPPFPR